MNFTFDKKVTTLSSININSFDLSNSSTILFQNSNLSIQPNTIYGLIGKNGCGKTSLLNQIYDMMNIQSVDSIKIDTLYVTQSIDHLISLEKNPIDFIMDSNSKLKIKTDELQIITKQLENIIDENEDDTFNMLNERSIELYDIVNTWNPETEKANVITAGTILNDTI